MTPTESTAADHLATLLKLGAAALPRAAFMADAVALALVIVRGGPGIDQDRAEAVAEAFLVRAWRFAREHCRG